ncbi:MAG TPA: aminotransferase class V-fold PLP-dependent enzyme [Gemmatimonadales bacterium]|nr:aminotransferase class V-fold PLP-dependent enzyme [Gemmatimonadales bacterium]
MTYDAKALRREEFPWADQRIYLNHASLGPLPARTLRAVNDFNTRRAVPFQVVGDDFLSIPANARAAAARLINATPDEIGLVQTTSLGLNLVANALPFTDGDLVVVSDKEFPSNVYPWKGLKDRGVGIEIVSCTPEGWPDEERLIHHLADPRVKAVAVSLIQFASGFRVDLARLSAETRKRNKLLIVDGIQGVGCYPIDVKKTPVDILTAAAQKWMLGPWGAGFIYVRKELLPTLAPRVANWLGYEGSDDVTQLTSYHDRHHPNARRFEISGHALQDLVGMIASAGLLAELGPAAIVEHVRGIHEPVIAAARRKGIPIASPTDAARPCTLSLRPSDPAALHAKLDANGVVCSLREGLVRLSPHCYNTIEEMEKVAALL